MADDFKPVPVAYKLAYSEKGEVREMTFTALIQWVREECARVARTAVANQARSIITGLKAALDQRTETMRAELRAEQADLIKELDEATTLMRREYRFLLDESAKTRDSLSRLKHDKDTAIRQIAEQCAPMVKNYISYGSLDGVAPGEPLPPKLRRKSANGKTEGHA